MPPPGMDVHPAQAQRPSIRRTARGHDAGIAHGSSGDAPLPLVPPNWPRGLGLAVLLAVLFFAVAAGAFPVVRRLTRRLEALKQGVERFGAGELSHRVEVSGRDEVAAVAASFNQAAGRVQALLRSHQSLLANASHELRSPLARMKMAVSMLDDARADAARSSQDSEIQTNVAELDALVEEVLLASRLDSAQTQTTTDKVDLLALGGGGGRTRRCPGRRTGAHWCMGEERLLRRALRNLLENAQPLRRRSQIQVRLSRESRSRAAAGV